MVLEESIYDSNLESCFMGIRLIRHGYTFREERSKGDEEKTLPNLTLCYVNVTLSYYLVGPKLGYPSLLFFRHHLKISQICS